MTIKYIGRHERIQNRELLNQISTAIFGTPEDINFAEEFVPPAGKIPNPKVANFAGFLVNGPKHLWAVFSDDNPKIPVGFILIADMPHTNSIGFCIKRNFAIKGLMRQAWEEIKNSSEWGNITFPLYGSTSQRNAAANQFLTNIGLKFIEETNFAGEPSNKYQYINQFNPPIEPPEESQITIDKQPDTLQKDEVKKVITKLISNNFPILDSTERKGTEMIYGCCGDPVNDYWKGKFCRCCGQSIILGNLVIGCGRTSACPYCNKLICGPHSFNGGGGLPVRRFCEICGKECNGAGNCPVHRLQQAN